MKRREIAALRWVLVACVSGFGMGTVASSALGQAAGDTNGHEEVPDYEPTPTGPKEVVGKGSILGRDYVITGYPSSAGPCLDIELSSFPGMLSGGCGEPGPDSGGIRFEMLMDVGDGVSYFWGTAPRATEQLRVTWDSGTKQMIDTTEISVALGESEPIALFVTGLQGQDVVQQVERLIDNDIVDVLRTGIPSR